MYGTLNKRVILIFPLTLILLGISIGACGKQQANVISNIDSDSSPLRDTNAAIVSSVVAGCAEDIAFYGDILYIADGPMGVKVVDISDVSNPVTIRSIPTLHAYKAYIYSDSLYICDASAGLKVYSLSNPEDPQLTFEEDTEWAASLAFYNDLLYLADFFEGYRIYDITDPRVPVLLRAYYGMRARGIVVADNTLFMADSPFGLSTFKIDDPLQPVLVHIDFTNFFNFEDVVYYNGYAMVQKSDEASKLSVFSIAPDKTVTLASEYTPARFIDGLNIYNNFLIVSCGEDGVKIYDMSTLPDLILVEEINTPDYALHAKISGGLLYVADFNSVSIYDPEFM